MRALSRSVSALGLNPLAQRSIHVTHLRTGPAWLLLTGHLLLLFHCICAFCGHVAHPWDTIGGLALGAVHGDHTPHPWKGVRGSRMPTGASGAQDTGFPHKGGVRRRIDAKGREAVVGTRA